MKTIYRDVLLFPQVPCPECGQVMAYTSEASTVYCDVSTCPNYGETFRVVNRSRVDLIHCGRMDAITLQLGYPIFRIKDTSDTPEERGKQ